MTDQKNTTRSSGGAGDFATLQLPDYLSESSALKPKLDEIFAEVQQNLPNIDFEISDVSSEEDIPIFHRALRTPTSEDGDLDSQLDASFDILEDDSFMSRKSSKKVGSDFDTPSALTTTKRPQSAPVKRLDNLESIENYRPPVKVDTWLKEQDEHLSEVISEESNEDKRAEIPELSPASSESDKYDHRQKSIFKEKADEVVYKYITPQEATLNLNSIDIDAMINNALSRTRNDGSSGSITEMDDPIPRDPSDPSTLLERLAQMSVAHSGTKLTNIDPHTGAVKVSNLTLKDSKTSSNNKTSLQTTTSKHLKSPADLANLPSIPRPEQPKNPDRDTVYIDLRGYNKNQKVEDQNFETVQRILRITNPQAEESSEEESEEENLDLWHEQRRRIKDSLSKTGQLPAAEPAKQKPELKKPSATLHAQKLAGHLPAEGHKAAKKEEPKSVDPPTPEPVKKQDVSSQEQLRRIEVAKKMREKKEQERQSRVRLGKRLEALRPTTSVSGKYPCAEATPTIFDVDASYEPAPQCLPVDVGSIKVDHVLLTVRLSSSGEIVQHRNPGNKSVDERHGFSATYPALLTWLLSLVPEDFSFLTEPARLPAGGPTAAPLLVVGLQQAFVAGQLCLYVAVVPSSQAVTQPQKQGKQKRKGAAKSQSGFQAAISHFLSTNTLSDVSPWLEDLTSINVNPAAGDNVYPFVYRAPVPKISTRPLSTFVEVSSDPQAVGRLFSMPPGFFWTTVEGDDPEHDHGLHDNDVNYDTQNTLSLIYEKVYRSPSSTIGILYRLLQEGLDLAGVRLVYPTTDLVNTNAGSDAARTPNLLGPLLALGLRGAFARSVWLDAVGPSDPALARRTDPNSLCALYGGATRAECLLFCPRNPDRISSELSRWFGGRVPASGVIAVGTDAGSRAHSKKQAAAGGGGKKVAFADQIDVPDLPSTRPPGLLVASIKSDIFLVISPMVPIRCFGLLIATAQRRGYQLRGVHRLKLNAKKLNQLGISQQKSFLDAGSVPSTPVSSSRLPFDPADLPRGRGAPMAPSTVLLLSKENAMHAAASLIEAFMVQMTLQNVLGEIQHASPSDRITSAALFHAVPMSDSLVAALGGPFTKTPECDLIITPGYIAPELYTNPEVEEIVVVTFTGFEFLKSFGLFLGRLLDLVPYSHRQLISAVNERFELLGMKWLPRLTLQQAKELTPCEVGDKDWKKSVKTLTSEPAIVLVMRGINAFARIASIIGQRSRGAGGSPSLDRIMSPSPDLAFRQATMFFRNDELFADPSSRSLRDFLPPVRLHHNTDRPSRGPHSGAVDLSREESIFATMKAGPVLLTTVLVLYPDVVTRHLAKVLRRIAQERFSIVGASLEYLDVHRVDFICDHNCVDAPVRPTVALPLLLSAPCLVLCLQRENAVKKLLDLVGPLDPKLAKRQSSFLWRAMFGTDLINNGMFVAEDYKTSVLATKLFFPDGVCCKPTPTLEVERIVCPAEDRILSDGARQQRRVERRKVTQQNGDHGNAQQNGDHGNAQQNGDHGNGQQNGDHGNAQQNGDHGNAGSTHKSTGTCSDLRCGELLLPVTSLTQTNCVLLAPSLLALQPRSNKLPAVEILHKLINEGYFIVGCRMIWFTQPQVERYLHLIDAGSFALARPLTAGPCMVLALQGDNAILSFDQDLGSSLDKDSLYSKYSPHILRAKNETQADKLLCFFFDSLLPSANVEIHNA